MTTSHATAPDASVLLDRDRLLPVEARLRDLARELYASVSDAPIISPHGHVPAEWLARDVQFDDPADLLITHDHYVTRLLHARGVALGELGVAGSAADPREVWRTFAEHWDSFAGTASGYWIRDELVEVLGVRDELSPATADAIYDHIQRRLRRPEFSARSLFERFDIEVLATTDDPLDSLEHHATLRESGMSGRVVPTFRPDTYVDPDQPEFRPSVERLLAHCGQAATFDGYLTALRMRREHFAAHGAVSTDHGVQDPETFDLEDGEAERLFARVLSDSADAAERHVFRGHMLTRMAMMSVEDGLVMTLHAGVLRNHSSRTLAEFGPDTGHDIPVRTDYVRGLRPLLEKVGLEPNFHLVLFAVDETVYSREIAPLAGFYPSVHIGAPWWFLDAPDAIARFRSAVTETAGFFKGSGFIDDTRAIMSIPARHDAARRCDAAFLARLVAEGRVPFEAALRIMDDVVRHQPRRVFKL